MTSGTGRCLQRKEMLACAVPAQGGAWPATTAHRGTGHRTRCGRNSNNPQKKETAAVYATAAVVNSFLTLSLSAPATLTGALGLLPFLLLQLCNVPIEDRLLLGREN